MSQSVQAVYRHRKLGESRGANLNLMEQYGNKPTIEVTSIGTLMIQKLLAIIESGVTVSCRSSCHSSSRCSYAIDTVH